MEQRMKPIRWLLVTLAFLVVTPASVAWAAPKTPPADDPEPQVFNFEEDEIRTDYLKPNTMLVEGIRRGRMSVLISVRLDFVDEIVKSAEDI